MATKDLSAGFCHIEFFRVFFVHSSGEYYIVFEMTLIVHSQTAATDSRHRLVNPGFPIAEVNKRQRILGLRES
jgi:hypothetical protein